MDALACGQSMKPVWWSLALGSCLVSSGSPIGASSSLIIAGFIECSGQAIRILPFMLLSIAVSSVYIYLRYLQADVSAFDCYSQ